jgi:hypothetical protein
MTKMTKSEMFEQIKKIMPDNQDIIDFCNEEIYKLQHKQMKATAKGRKNNLDELAKECLDILKQAKEPMTDVEILYKLDYDEDLTVARVRARTAQLIKCGYINKGIRIEFDKHKVVYYI